MRKKKYWKLWTQKELPEPVRGLGGIGGRGGRRVGWYAGLIWKRWAPSWTWRVSSFFVCLWSEQAYGCACGVCVAYYHGSGFSFLLNILGMCRSKFVVRTTCCCARFLYYQQFVPFHKHTGCLQVQTPDWCRMLRRIFWTQIQLLVRRRRWWLGVVFCELCVRVFIFHPQTRLELEVIVGQQFGVFAPPGRPPSPLAPVVICGNRNICKNTHLKHTCNIICHVCRKT